MNLRPSNFWFDGACFKCAHYIIGQGGRLCTKHDTVQWIKGIIESRHKGIEEPDKPQSLIDYLDDSKTKAIRNQMKRGYISLEDYQ